MAGYQTPPRLPSSSSVFTDCARFANSARSSGVVLGSACSRTITLLFAVKGSVGTSAAIASLLVGDEGGVLAPAGEGNEDEGSFEYSANVKSNTRSLSSGLNFTRSSKLVGRDTTCIGASSVLRSFVEPVFRMLGLPIPFPLASILITVAENPATA